MDKEQNIQQLVKDLYDENEKLKEENKDLKFKLKSSDENYSESLNKAKEMIETCGNLIAQYNESLVELHKAKDEYKSANKEVRVIKKKYENELKNIINKI